MMANDPELFKSKVQETLRRHTMQLINTPPKELISLIMEMLLLEASRAGATIMALKIMLTLGIPVMYKT
jgi:urocanate hydratase